MQNKNFLFTPLEKCPIARNCGAVMSFLRGRRLMPYPKFLMGFTLILMASCFGILGMGGESNAACSVYAGMSQEKTSYTLGETVTINFKDAPAGSILSFDKYPGGGSGKKWEWDAHQSGYEQYTLLSTDATGTYQISLYGGNGICNTIKYITVKSEKTCKEACAGISMFSKCSNETCSDICVNVGGNYFCRYNCIAKSDTTCKDTCICYDSESCDPCNATICTANGCEKEVAVCKCTSYKDTGNCGPAGGCRTDQMHRTRTCTPAGCKSETQCITHSNCGGATPNPCYWQNKGCGNAEPGCGCKNTKMCQKCIGDSGCGGGCTLGQHQCVYDSNCGCGGGGGDFEDTGGGGAVTFNNPLSTNSFETLIMGIINWILGIVVSLAILFLIIGGLMYITSAGDEERIKKAKNIILYAVVGLGVVILSWSIITELKDILGVK